MDGMLLTNKHQKKVVKVVYERMQELMKSAKKSDESNTFAPSYDIILDEK